MLAEANPGQAKELLKEGDVETFSSDNPGRSKVKDSSLEKPRCVCGGVFVCFSGWELLSDSV